MEAEVYQGAWSKVLRLLDLEVFKGRLSEVALFADPSGTPGMLSCCLDKCGRRAVEKSHRLCCASDQRQEIMLAGQTPQSEVLGRLRGADEAGQLGWVLEPTTDISGGTLGRIESFASDQTALGSRAIFDAVGC